MNSAMPRFNENIETLFLLQSQSEALNSSLFYLTWLKPQTIRLNWEKLSCQTKKFIFQFMK